MGYSIVENNAVAFADSRSIKFPRFQRKQTWNDKDNFKLCISVFKDYPIGVVIINSQDGNDFLLDGRQRRNALKLMKDDPKSVYIWAKSFVGFTPNQDVEELKEKFWISIDEYLQHEAAKMKGSEVTEETQESAEEEIDENEEIIDGAENAYSFEKQYNSLKSLLDLVLLCHPMKSGKTNLQKMFEFNGLIEKSELDYADPVEGEYVINSVKLKKYIDSLNENEDLDVDEFVSMLAKRYRVTGQKLDKLTNYINQHWDFYKKSLDVIESINRVLGRAKIGSVTLTNADVLDAQNIFSLVNHSGTPLSAEELLSARPFWNISLVNPSAELLEYKKEMYKFLGINLPDETCRWDLCSTFLKRIDRHGLIFENEKNSFTTSISLSYRIISSLLVGGINNTSVTMLEKAKIDWEVDIERIIKEINLVIDLLEDINYFKHILAWRQSVMSLTSNSIAMEFCALMYKSWQELGKPTKNSANIRAFNKRAVTLFDRLVYEYGIRMWTGSGDSMVASHLKDTTGSRYVMIGEKEWLDFIEAIVSGSYKGKPTSSKTLKPFLYNYYFLRELDPTLLNDNTKYDIDHLVAQKFFKDNDSLDQTLKDNFVNFSILPKGENIEKTDKKLNEIHDAWLISQIKKFADITDEDIETFSDLSQISALIKRKDTYEKAYSELRNRLFANL